MNKIVTLNALRGNSYSLFRKIPLMINSVNILEEDGTERVFQKSDIALIRLAFDF